MDEANLTLHYSFGNQPRAVQIIAKVVSYILHPLFIPTYIFLWLVKRFAINFAGITQQ
jgi:hypothetical protein